MKYTKYQIKNCATYSSLHGAPIAAVTWLVLPCLSAWLATHWLSRDTDHPAPSPGGCHDWDTVDNAGRAQRGPVGSGGGH